MTGTGADLRALRRGWGLAQWQIAVATGVSQARISQVEQSRHVSDAWVRRYVVAVRDLTERRP